MIFVRRMKESERMGTVSFIDQAMQDRYQCDAHELPKIVFVALRFGELVGTISLSGEESGSLLPLQEIYDLDPECFPTGFARNKAIQFGRWVATIRGVSEVLLYVAIVYSLSKGFGWGISEVKSPVEEHFARMGISLIFLRGKLVMSKILPKVLPYYTLPPKPSLCIISLEAAEKTLRDRVEERISKGRIIVNYY